MTDYLPLIQRAVEGLAKNTGEARRGLYERARAALVAQLRSVQPVLAESEITKERLALEEAIRKVEAEAARKALTDPRTPALAEPRAAASLSRSAAAATKAVAAAVEEKPAASAAEDKPSTSAGERKPAFPSTEAKPSFANAGLGLRRERLTAAANDLPSSGRTPPRGNERLQPLRQDDAAAESETETPAAKPTARDRILGARTASIRGGGLKGFRNAVSEAVGLGAAATGAAQEARETRESYTPPPRSRAQADEYPPPEPLAERSPTERITPARYRPHIDESELPPEHEEALPLHGLEPEYGFGDEEPQPPRYGRQHSPADDEFDDEEHEYEDVRPPRSYRGWAKLAAVLIIVGGVAGTAWEYRSNIAGIYDFVAHRSSSTPAAHTTPQQQKFSGRVPQETVPGQAPLAGGAPGGQQGPEVAQRAVLLEQDANDPQGKRYPGSVTWRTETVSPGPGLAPELEVRADIVIPERHLNVTWSLRRNTDKALPASHTIQVMFNLPPNFPGGGISSVPGIFAKNAEEATGTPLAGISVKVTDTYFLLGLSADPTLQQRNIQLLKSQEWFDIAIVYRNGAKAILAIERGPPGDRAFAEAFKAWGE